MEYQLSPNTAGCKQKQYILQHSAEDNAFFYCVVFIFCAYSVTHKNV